MLVTRVYFRKEEAVKKLIVQSVLPTNNLKEFKVQGWLADPDNLKSKDRKPMKVVKVKAINDFMAAATYAHIHGIPEKFWNNGSATPPIVIRVER